MERTWEEAIVEASQMTEWTETDYAREWGIEHAVHTGHLRMEVIR